MQKLQRLQHVKVAVQAVKGQSLIFGFSVLLHLGGEGEESGDVQQFLRRQRGVNLQKAKVGPDVGQTLKR